MHAEVTSAGEDFAPGDNADSKSVVLVRNFVVDNTSDAGSGSLRQAIEDARGLCTSSPCTVVFHIPGPVPAGGWFTIRPLSSLPEARGYLHINGSTQTTFTGDTNAEGPEIEISGALAGDASGLTLNTGCDLEVKGLAINGFARDGIDVIAPPYGVSCGRAPTITESYLGTDPRGRTAIPNERGIVAAGLVTIGNNLIGGNRRSGIFCNGPGYALISENRIGIGTGDVPLGNGASGIFLNHSDGLVASNVIANSAQWGVGRTYGDEEVSLSRNAIFGSGVMAYDIGLDFETANSSPDSNRPPNKPVLFAAFYDPVSGTTTVRGHLDSDPRNGALAYQPRLELFASQAANARGYVEEERYVGTLVLEPNATHADFVFSAPGDLRGQLITANFTRSRIDSFSSAATSVRGVAPAGRVSEFPSETSELSNAVPVQ
jgi:hypothetical protein